MKPGQTLLVVLLAGAGVALLLKSRSSRPSSSEAQQQATAIQPRPAPVDLTSFYDNDPSFNAPGSWQTVPRGLQRLANIPFQIDGLIQLWGQGPAGMGRTYRERVEGIPARGRFETLYALHATSFTAQEGTPIAEIVFHYADGSAATNFIRYGTDSRDWWQPLVEHTALPTNSMSKVVWRGDHASLPDWVRCLRLFGAAIPNPKAGTDVTGIDLVSTKSQVTWVVLALTTGPAGLMKADPALQVEEDASVEEITMILTAVDNATGTPVKGTKFQITLQSGRRPKPFGRFTADAQGQAIVDLPPERIRLLSIEAVAGDYSPSILEWNAEGGTPIPTNYVFKLSKP